MIHIFLSLVKLIEDCGWLEYACRSSQELSKEITEKHGLMTLTRPTREVIVILEFKLDYN